MRQKGLPKKEILARLKAAQARDLKYKDGKILCSMCTQPYPAARRAHGMFLDSNLGDSGLFAGAAQLEREAVASLAQLLHAPAGYAGFIVSGGTEANLLAMYAAREQAAVSEPEVIAPESAHFSFDKICNLLKLKPIKAPLSQSFTVDPATVKQLVTKRTVAIVGNAGSVELGTVDPIEDLSEIAQDHNLPLHVDAAFGGLVLPFLKELGYPVPAFDFCLGGVQSMTVDPHKMGMSTVPAGGILFRNQKILQRIRTQTPYLTEEYQCTFVGTRSGASAAATWAAFESLGREGFRKAVKRCMDATAALVRGLEAAGFEVLAPPTMNIAAFRSADSQMLAGKLQQQGWYVSYIPRLSCILVVVMPHTTRRHVAEFLTCLTQLEK
jgi:tyrosine decarboxylase/aspartate 1-decarboxylase